MHEARTASPPKDKEQRPDAKRRDCPCSRGARAHNTAQYVKSPQRIRSRRGASISARTRRAERLRRLAGVARGCVGQGVQGAQGLGHRACSFIFGRSSSGTDMP